MKTLTKALAVIMAALILALSCAVVIAEDDEREEPMRPSLSISGTYAGKAWTLSAAGSSAALITSTGTYAVDEYMKLLFQPTFYYQNALGEYVNLTGAANVLYYGNYFTNSLTKSYTVAQAASHFYIEEYGVTLDHLLPHDAIFKKCKYSLKLDSNPVGSFTVNYE